MSKKIIKQVVAIRLTPNMKKKLESYAEQKELTVSELIRRVLENYIDQKSI